MKRTYMLTLLVVGLTAAPALTQGEKSEKPAEVTSELLSECIYGVDEGFNSYVNLDLLGRGFEELNSEMMTDAVLQLGEGERVLQRKHKAIDSNELTTIVVKLAAEKNDTQSLARLAKFAEARGNTELGKRITAAQKMTGASRRMVPSLVDDYGKAPGGAVWGYEYLNTRLVQARLLGDLEMIERIEGILKEVDTLPERRDELLKGVSRDKKLMMTIRGGDESKSSKVTKEALRKLSDGSRGLPKFFNNGQLTQKDRDNILTVFNSVSGLGNAPTTGRPITGGTGRPNTGSTGRPITGGTGRPINPGTPTNWGPPRTGGAIPVDPWGRPVNTGTGPGSGRPWGPPVAVTYTRWDWGKLSNGRDVLFFHGSDGHTYYQCSPTCSKMHFYR